MANTHNTLQLIADILSFEDNQDRLQNKLSSNNDLDDLVINGSKHLTLPSQFTADFLQKTCYPIYLLSYKTT